MPARMSDPPTFVAPESSGAMLTGYLSAIVLVLLAGALHMPWRKFVLFNFLGASVWVTLICGAGYLFGRHWGRLAYDLRRFDLAVSIAVVVGALAWWWRSRRSQTGSAP